jgi:hypothetical protein
LSSTEQKKLPRVNGHVARLNRFLPFSVSHDQIYEEYQTDENGLSLETEAYVYIQRALDSGAKCIVLTGDAGHGKTHLCRKILEKHLGYGLSESRSLLLSHCDGQKSIAPHESRGHIGPKPLRIHKDFSEIDIQSARDFIEFYGDSPNEALVICANEGRLRAVINDSKAGKVCENLREIFQKSFKTGLSSQDGQMHIVNLNFQSVASRSHSVEKSLVRRTLREWVIDGRRWNSSCGSCSLSDNCPIKKNRDLLGDDGDVSGTRIEGIERLFATVERLGHVITIREMLMLTAYMITGGLTCEKVKTKIEKHPSKGWQHEYAYYNLLFRGPTAIPEDRLHKGIPILTHICRLDPGKTARRTIDDRLLNLGGVFPSGQLDLLFEIQFGTKVKIIDSSNGIDDVIGSPQSRTDLSRESDSVRKVVAGLRRRSFFDEAKDAKDMLSRMGFRYGDDFLAMLEGEMLPQSKVKLKNLLVAGLHGIQGLRLSLTETTLYLVDPAFGRANADASIIARQIPTQDITILSEQLAWNTDESTWALSKSVDWTDRTIVVRIEEKTGPHHKVEIAFDLMDFECVARSASGYISEGFYAHKMRRIRTFLGKIAERGRGIDGQISLFIDGKVNSVSIDIGVIQVSGGGGHGGH